MPAQLGREVSIEMWDAAVWVCAIICFAAGNHGSKEDGTSAIGIKQACAALMGEWKDRAGRCFLGSWRAEADSRLKSGREPPVRSACVSRHADGAGLPVYCRSHRL